MLNETLKIENLLLKPIKLGELDLSNRFAMAPLTRQRAAAGLVTTLLHAEYYAQRATAGLIISEASQISPRGMGYPNTPGIYSQKQVEGWKLVTEAVHAREGKIFCQLWHVGRHSHPLLQEDGGLPVAPSAVAEVGHVTTLKGKMDPVVPHPLSKTEIEQIIADYSKAARNAIDAGFDGVEIHGANGYLIEQFLNDNSNLRTDEYGGSIANKIRFALEVTAAVVREIGPDKVGIRLSPSGTNFGVRNSDPVATFTQLIERLNTFNLAYIHLIEPFAHLIEGLPQYLPKPTSYFRPMIQTVLISGAGYTFATADEAIKKGDADMIAFGRDFISNPDLVYRYERQKPLNAYDTETFYGGDSRGYTDYPFYGRSNQL